MTDISLHFLCAQYGVVTCNFLMQLAQMRGALYRTSTGTSQSSFTTTTISSNSNSGSSFNSTSRFTGVRFWG